MNRKYTEGKIGGWNSISVWLLKHINLTGNGFCVTLKTNSKIYMLFPITSEISHRIAYMQSTRRHCQMWTYQPTSNQSVYIPFCISFLLLISLPFTYALIHFSLIFFPSFSFLCNFFFISFFSFDIFRSFLLQELLFYMQCLNGNAWHYDRSVASWECAHSCNA